GQELRHLGVMVHVGGDCSPCCSHVIGYPRLSAYIGKSSDFVVVKKPARHGGKDARDAVVTFAIGGDAASGVLVEPRKLADEQIESAVVVVVEPHRAGRPTLNSDSSLFSDIAKSSVSIVAIEDTAAILCDVEVLESVV